MVDGRFVDVVIGVEVESVVGGDVVVGIRYDVFFYEDVESIVLEYFICCKLFGKFIRIWIKYFLEVKREYKD